MTLTELYDMKLHEMRYVTVDNKTDFRVMRVADGWIYFMITPSLEPVFVPDLRSVDA